jgi:hypothetical protein
VRARGNRSDRALFRARAGRVDRSAAAHLARLAKCGRTPADHDARYPGAAPRTRLAGVTVDSENVAPLVRVRGHAHVELFADRLAETAHELTDVGARQRVASRTRVDARVPEGLGGQDVSHPGENGLIHDNVFDGAAAFRERRGERGRVDTVHERIRSQRAPFVDVAVGHDQSAKTSGVEVARTRIAPVFPRDVDAGALRAFGRRARVALDPPARHSEVREEAPAVVEQDLEPFAAPAHVPNCAPFRRAGKRTRCLRPQNAPIRGVRASDRGAAEHVIEPPPRDLHVGKLRHRHSH